MVYGTGPATVCWGGRPVGERAFCVGCHGTKDNRDVDRSKCGPLAIIDRLAAYEDTGLEPVDIEALLKREQGLAELLVNVSCGCAVSYTRLAELAQAEKDGRLVVLPCKVCDTVYIIRDQKIITATVESIHQWCSGKWKLNAHTDKRYTHWVGYEICLDEFGKTVFLTREEAEATLGKGGDRR